MWEFEVTNDWLNEYKTSSGGYTSVQLAAFDIFDWPPPKGWKKRVIGKKINFKTKRAFEIGALKTKKTGPSVKQVIEIIKNKELSGQEAQELLKALSESGYRTARND